MGNPEDVLGETEVAMASVGAFLDARRPGAGDMIVGVIPSDRPNTQQFVRLYESHIRVLMSRVSEAQDVIPALGSVAMRLLEGLREMNTVRDWNGRHYIAVDDLAKLLEGIS